MKFFWPIYFFAAVVGTAGVYLAAPLARPYVDAVFGTTEPASVRDESTPQGAAVLQAVPPSSPAQDSGADARARPGTGAAARPPLPDDGDEAAPAMNGIYPVSRNEKPGWGITFQRTSYFGLDGARLGHVPGGVLLEYRDKRVASIGNMVECVLLENGTPSAPLLVSRKDVLLFTGSYTKLTARQRADLQAYYALSGKIGLRKTELLQAAAAKNPFFATYNQAYKSYMAHIDAAKALTEKRDHAAEQDKTRLEDQLREMKVAETALRQEYDAIHAKFRLWKEQHTNEIAKAETDADVQKWSQEMKALRTRIPGLAL